MSYRVRTDNFEGPFDILLYLVSRKQVDIASISVAEIADQYLEEISKLSLVDLDVCSDFLLVASTLLELKAASLVPNAKDETDEEIAELGPDEARELLVQRLLEYKKFKNAAGMLEARSDAQDRMHARVFGPPVELTTGLMPDFLEGIPLETIGVIAAEIFARRDMALLDSDHIAAKPIPVEVHVRSLHYRLMEKKKLRFSEMIEPGAPKAIVVVTFLAILELYKRALVDISQGEQFGDIDVSYIEGASSAGIEDVDTYETVDVEMTEDEPTKDETIKRMTVEVEVSEDDVPEEQSANTVGAMKES